MRTLLPSLPALRRPLLLTLLGLVIGMPVSHAADQLLPRHVSSVVREAFAVRAFDDIELPQGSVRTIHVASTGDLWAGTREGLVQYKRGHQQNWRQTADGRSGLPSGTINALHEDAQGDIWIGTARGVGRYSPADGSLRIIARAGNEADDGASHPLDIACLMPIEDALLAATRDGRLLLVGAEGLVALTLDGAAPAAFSDREKLRILSCTHRDSRVFLGSETDGIFEVSLDGTAYRFSGMRAAGHTIVEMHALQDELLWLDRDFGLHRQDLAGREEPRQFHPQRGQTQGYYRAMYVESPDSVWLGAGPTVIRVRDGRTDTVRLPGRGNEVRNIRIDRVGNIWIGSYYGLFYAVDTDFNSLRTSAAYDAGIIRAVAEHRGTIYLGGQNLWYGPLGAARFEELLRRTDGQPIKGLRTDPLSVEQNPITSIAVDDGLLLLGYYVGGMDVVDLDTGLVTTPRGSEGLEPFLPNVGVSGLLQVDKQHWLGTFFFHGLVEITVKRTDAAPQVTLQRISDVHTPIAIYPISARRYLMVSQTGLYRVARSTDGSYRVTPLADAPQELVFAVASDGAGGLFVGVENTGIRHLSAADLDAGRYRPQRLSFTDEVLEQRTIWHLLKDGDRLWASTNSGLYVFDLQQRRSLSHVGYRYGLPSNEFEYGQHAALLDDSGQKYFVTSRGPVVFREPVTADRSPVMLQWTAVRQNGRAMSSTVIGTRRGATLNVPFETVRSGVLELEFAYSDHVRAIDTHYAVRYNGGDWEPIVAPVITLARQERWGPLDLEIALLDSSGQVTSAPAGITLDIRPPWYILRTPNWYRVWDLDLRVFAVLALSLVAVAALLLRVRQRAADAARRERELLEAEMRGRLSEQEVLLREIQHRVGNLLSSFAASIRGMQRRAESDEAQSVLEQLAARVRVQSSVHALLQRSGGTDIDVALMLRQIAAGARDLYAGEAPAVVETNLEPVYMTYSKAQYLGLIVNELLTNSAKHGRPSGTQPLAELSLQWREGCVYFHYRDHGSNPLPQAVLSLLADDTGGGRRANAPERPTDRRNDGSRQGIGQILALARELRSEARFHTDQGLHTTLILRPPLVAQQPRTDA